MKRTLGTKRALALLLAFVLTLPLSVTAFASTEELAAKYDYNFYGDPLQLQKHEDGRTYASREIAELAEWFGDDTENYINALSRVGIIGFVIKGGSNRIGIISGSGYPHGKDVEEYVDILPPVDDFPDVIQSAWYYDAVKEVALGGLVYGNENGIFRPGDHVTVAELSAILCRVYNLPLHIFYQPWYGPYIDALQVAVLDFSSCDREYAGQPVTRGEAIEEMLVMALAQGRERTRSLTWDDVQDAAACRSVPQQHAWSPDAILDALNYGVIDGVNAAHRVNPDGFLTRAELCKMLQNIGVTKARSVSSFPAFEAYRQYRENR